MRIAIFHELDFGGAKRVVLEFAKKLKKNHVVDLYYVDEYRDNNVKNHFNKTYHYKFNSKIWKGNDWKARIYKDTIELINLYNLHKKIAGDIKSEKYDYIFVHPSKLTQAPFLLRFLKNKCIYYCQEPLRMIYDSAVFSNIKNIPFPKNLYEFSNRKIRKWIDSENFKCASIILANSNYSKSFIEKCYGRKVELCYLGIDTDLFKPLNIDKSIDILFIGNKDNGLNLLNNSLKFFHINPKVKVIFRKNGKFILSDKELVKIYNKSKVLVSLNKNEPFGLIPLEAMSCGTPVVAVSEGGYKESIIDNKTGFLISRDAHELYEKINSVIGNDKLRLIMAKNARENVLQNWTLDKSIERFFKIINYEK